MNFFSQATQYLVTLKEKGFFDKEFYEEYDYICLETYKIRHPEAIQEVNIVQTNSLLQREKLR